MLMLRRSNKIPLPLGNLRNSWRIRSSVALFLGMICLASAPAAEPEMRIRLKDGSFSTGRVVGIDNSNQLGWRSELFEVPLRFNVEAIRSVTSALNQTQEGAEQTANSESATGQLFELSTGGVVVGRLVTIDDTWVVVDSDLLGQVKLAREGVTAIVDAGYAGQIVYSGPIDDDRWQRLTEPEDWEFEAGALVATKQGAAIVGNVQLPPKSQIGLSLSWRGAPDFVLSLGTLATNKVSKVEEVPSAARLEVWANQLALVREVDGGADIAMLSDLSDANPRIDLTVYLDQIAGTIVVCDSHGRPLETLKVPSEKSVVRPAVHIANSGPSLTIERFEVREWDGVASTVASSAHSVLDSEGENRDGFIVGFDADTQKLKIALASGELSELPLVQLRRGNVATSNQQVEQALKAATKSTDDALPPTVVQPPQFDPDNSAPAVPAQAESPSTASSASAEATGADQSIEIILSDRTRLSGSLLQTDNPKLLRFAALGLAEEVSFPCEAVRGVIGTTDRFIPDDGQQVVGTLKVGDSQLAGYLDEVSTPIAEGASGLWWHPSGSLNASPLNPTVSGAIIYRKPLPLQTAAEVATQRNRVQVLAPAVGMFLGNKRPSNAQANQPLDAAPPEAREVMFRTGDAVDGIVERIDENGMIFRSSQTTTTFAPHNLIQHVWLNRAHGALETSPEKLKRLMTVPRSMKQDPPTHLFIAVTGDYLRGRLVRLEGDRLTIEVRLELVELSTSQIAQVIWLHDRDWSDKPAGADKEQRQDTKENEDNQPGAAEQTPPEHEEPFLVHAIGRSDRGLTFRPEKLVDGILSGHSGLLGECSIAVGELNQLLFGRNIHEQIRAFRADPWTLSLAQYPRVYLDDGSESAAPAGGASPMVGKPAVDFSLKSLDGQSFRLSKNHDRIVVLDFWASWCGPCIQTMPLVEQVVDELGTDRIHLVAVNIQETQARASAAVERLEMNATVLLDIDGQTAAAYAANAIPQTVIIDRAGVVTHVFVGGGPKFVEQFRQALLATLNGIPNEQ